MHVCMHACMHACMYACMYVCTRWRLLDRTSKALVRNLHGGSRKPCGQVRAAHRWTGAKPVRFTLSFAFCQPFRQARATQQHRNCADESKGCSAKFVPTTCEIRRKIGRKSTKNRAKSSKNRRKIALGRFWALKAISGMRRDALGTARGRPNVAQRPILRRPGRAKSGQDTSKSVPGPLRRRSRTAPEQCPTAFGASSTIERAR